MMEEGCRRSLNWVQFGSIWEWYLVREYPLDNVLKPKTWGGFWDRLGKRTIDLLGIQKGSMILDVGTGGGSTLFPALEKAGPTGQVIGIDKRASRVKPTHAEIQRCGFGNVQIMIMDAREMGLDDNSFDYAIAGFVGWGNWFDFQLCEFKEPDLLMEEIYRVLKSGGKLGVSTWVLQGDLDWMKQFLASHSIPSKLNYSRENEKGWRMIMSSAGFRNLRFATKTIYHTHTSIGSWWDYMMRRYRWVEEQEDSEMITDSVRAQAFNSVQGHVTDAGGVRFKKTALIILGTK